MSIFFIVVDVVANWKLILNGHSRQCSDDPTHQHWKIVYFCHMNAYKGSSSISWLLSLIWLAVAAVLWIAQCGASHNNAPYFNHVPHFLSPSVHQQLRNSIIAAHHSSEVATSPNMGWLVTSRPMPSIKKRLSICHFMKHVPIFEPQFSPALVVCAMKMKIVSSESAYHSG